MKCEQQYTVCLCVYVRFKISNLQTKWKKKMLERKKREMLTKSIMHSIDRKTSDKRNKKATFFHKAPKATTLFSHTTFRTFLVAYVNSLSIHFTNPL